MSMATPATLITLGMTMRPELRFALHQAQERCPSTDDVDMLTMHVEALAQFSRRRENVALVILNPGGAINRQEGVEKDRLGSSTQSWTK
jgi:hypothetical protein